MPAGTVEIPRDSVTMRTMTTLTEIESAVASLPRREQRKLHALLSRRLESPPAQKKVSAHDLMQDGCGIVDSGVGDLSNKKKHLSRMGFGA